MIICVIEMSDIWVTTIHIIFKLNPSKTQHIAYWSHANLLKKIIRIDKFLTCRIKLQEVMIRMAYSSGSGPTSFLTASRSDVCLWLWLWLWLRVDAVGQFGVSRKENQWLLKLPSGWHPTPPNKYPHSLHQYVGLCDSFFSFESFYTKIILLMMPCTFWKQEASGI